MIPPIKKILYATDLSKNSIYAFYYAVDMAKRYDARMVVLNVIEPISVRAYGSQTDKLQAGQQEAAMEVVRVRLQKFCEKMEQKNSLPCLGLIDKILVKVGDPASEILKTSKEEGSDLLILGDHSKGFLAEALLGSVSRAVLDRAKKPVTVIPLPAEDTVAWDEI
jgi:nucleotide-binding universal stress UspA family protein